MFGLKVYMVYIWVIFGIIKIVISVIREKLKH